MNRFERTLSRHDLSLHRAATQVLQLNIGKKCNQSCAHCHVNAGPARRETMTRETMERVLLWLAPTSIATVDITGGAPELHARRGVELWWGFGVIGKVQYQKAKPAI